MGDLDYLLSSEIARMVYGYLEDQKCNEAAQSFLEHSPFLAECLATAKAGRKFVTKVHGSSLMDVLNDYGAAQTFVAEKLCKLPGEALDVLEKHKRLVERLKFLLDSAKAGQTVAVSISVLPHGSPQSNNSSSVSHLRIKTPQSSDRKRASIRFQGPEFKKRLKSKGAWAASVEPSAMNALPGGSGPKDAPDLRVDSSAEESGCEKNFLTSDEPNEEPQPNSVKLEKLKVCVKSKDQSFSSVSPGTGGEAAEDRKSEDNTCSPRKKIKSKKKSPFSPAKGSPGKIESESPGTQLHKALLENKALHEKIAENINRVMRNPLQEGTEDSEAVIQELNDAIQTIVDKTEQDPVFQRFLDEIIGVDEDVSSSPAGGESEAEDGANVVLQPSSSDEVQSSETVNTNSEHSEHVSEVEGETRRVDSEEVAESETVSGDHAKPCERFVEEESAKDPKDQIVEKGKEIRSDHEEEAHKNVEITSPNEIPLKQRLRSARKTDSSGSTKKDAGDKSSLEDQNEAAIQCIIDAKAKQLQTLKTPEPVRVVGSSQGSATEKKHDSTTAQLNTSGHSEGSHRDSGEISQSELFCAPDLNVSFALDTPFKNQILNSLVISDMESSTLDHSYPDHPIVVEIPGHDNNTENRMEVSGSKEMQPPVQARGAALGQLMQDNNEVNANFHMGQQYSQQKTQQLPQQLPQQSIQQHLQQPPHQLPQQLQQLDLQQLQPQHQQQQLQQQPQQHHQLQQPQHQSQQSHQLQQPQHQPQQHQLQQPQHQSQQSHQPQQPQHQPQQPQQLSHLSLQPSHQPVQPQLPHQPAQQSQPPQALSLQQPQQQLQIPTLQSSQMIPTLHLGQLQSQETQSVPSTALATAPFIVQPSNLQPQLLSQSLPMQQFYLQQGQSSSVSPTSSNLTQNVIVCSTDMKFPEALVQQKVKNYLNIAPRCTSYSSSFLPPQYFSAGLVQPSIIIGPVPDTNCTTQTSVLGQNTVFAAPSYQEKKSRRNKRKTPLSSDQPMYEFLNFHKKNPSSNRRTSEKQNVEENSDSSCLSAIVTAGGMGFSVPLVGTEDATQQIVSVNGDVESKSMPLLMFNSQGDSERSETPGSDRSDIPVVDLEDKSDATEASAATNVAAAGDQNNEDEPCIPLSAETESVRDDSDKSGAPPVKHSVVKENHEQVSGGKETSEHIIKVLRDTPQTFVAGRPCSNPRRLSLSTPRRATHVRTLDFGTPPKPGTDAIAGRKSLTSPKNVNEKQLIRDPSASLGTQGRSVRSMLFKSPDPAQETSPAGEGTETCVRQSVPIATRSPVVPLQGGWDKATGMGMIFGSPEEDSSKENRTLRLTPKTLFFSPESGSENEGNVQQEGNTSGTEERTAVVGPSRLDSNTMPPPAVPASTRTTEVAKDTPSKHVTTAKDTPSKIKSRAWDADLRAIVYRDYTDVDVCPEINMNQDGLSSQEDEPAEENQKSHTPSTVRSGKKSKASEKCVAINENITNKGGMIGEKESNETESSTKETGRTGAAKKLKGGVNEANSKRQKTPTPKKSPTKRKTNNKQKKTTVTRKAKTATRRTRNALQKNIGENCNQVPEQIEAGSNPVANEETGISSQESTETSKCSQESTETSKCSQESTETSKSSQESAKISKSSQGSREQNKGRKTKPRRRTVTPRRKPGSKKQSVAAQNTMESETTVSGTPVCEKGLEVVTSRLDDTELSVYIEVEKENTAGAEKKLENKDVTEVSAHIESAAEGNTTEKPPPVSSRKRKASSEILVPRKKHHLNSKAEENTLVECNGEVTNNSTRTAECERDPSSNISNDCEVEKSEKHDVGNENHSVRDKYQNEQNEDVNQEYKEVETPCKESDKHSTSQSSSTSFSSTSSSSSSTEGVNSVIDLSSTTGETSGVINCNDNKEISKVPNEKESKKLGEKVLETPMKNDKFSYGVPPTPCLNSIPMTPRVLSPCHSVATPMTKFDHNEGIGFSAVATPSLPPTPKIAITPHFASPGHLTRPTDYSSCSSYYNPSDSSTPLRIDEAISGDRSSVERQIPVTFPGSPEEQQTSRIIDSGSCRERSKTCIENGNGDGGSQNNDGLMQKEISEYAIGEQTEIRNEDKERKNPKSKIKPRIDEAVSGDKSSVERQNPGTFSGSTEEQQNSKIIDSGSCQDRNKTCIEKSTAGNSSGGSQNNDGLIQKEISECATGEQTETRNKDKERKTNRSKIKQRIYEAVTADRSSVERQNSRTFSASTEEQRNSKIIDSVSCQDRNKTCNEKSTTGSGGGGSQNDDGLMQKEISEGATGEQIETRNKDKERKITRSKIKSKASQHTMKEGDNFSGKESGAGVENSQELAISENSKGNNKTKLLHKDGTDFCLPDMKKETMHMLQASGETLKQDTGFVEPKKGNKKNQIGKSHTKGGKSNQPVTGVADKVASSKAMMDEDKGATVVTVIGSDSDEESLATLAMKVKNSVERLPEQNVVDEEDEVERNLWLMHLSPAVHRKSGYKEGNSFVAQSVDGKMTGQEKTIGETTQVLNIEKDEKILVRGKSGSKEGKPQTVLRKTGGKEKTSEEATESLDNAKGEDIFVHEESSNKGEKLNIPQTVLRKTGGKEKTSEETTESLDNAKDEGTFVHEEPSNKGENLNIPQTVLRKTGGKEKPSEKTTVSLDIGKGDNILVYGESTNEEEKSNVSQSMHRKIAGKEKTCEETTKTVDCEKSEDRLVCGTLANKEEKSNIPESVHSKTDVTCKETTKLLDNKKGVDNIFHQKSGYKGERSIMPQSVHGKIGGREETSEGTTEPVDIEKDEEKDSLVTESDDSSDEDGGEDNSSSSSDSSSSDSDDSSGCSSTGTSSVYDENSVNTHDNRAESGEVQKSVSPRREQDCDVDQRAEHSVEDNIRESAECIVKHSTENRTEYDVEHNVECTAKVSVSQRAEHNSVGNAENCPDNNNTTNSITAILKYSATGYSISSPSHSFSSELDSKKQRTLRKLRGEATEEKAGKENSRKQKHTQTSARSPEQPTNQSKEVTSTQDQGGVRMVGDAGFGWSEEEEDEVFPSLHISDSDSAAESTDCNVEHLNTTIVCDMGQLASTKAMNKTVSTLDRTEERAEGQKEDTSSPLLVSENTVKDKNTESCGEEIPFTSQSAQDECELYIRLAYSELGPLRNAEPPEDISDYSFIYDCEELGQKTFTISPLLGLFEKIPPERGGGENSINDSKLKYVKDSKANKGKNTSVTASYPSEFRHKKISVFEILYNEATMEENHSTRPGGRVRTSSYEADARCSGSVQDHHDRRRKESKSSSRQKYESGKKECSSDSKKAEKTKCSLEKEEGEISDDSPMKSKSSSGLKTSRVEPSPWDSVRYRRSRSRSPSVFCKSSSRLVSSTSRDVHCLPPKKRKTAETEEIEGTEKRHCPAPAEIRHQLRNLDIDTFLSKVHGQAERK